MLERILIATDGSEHSKKAADKAIELAKLSGGKVIALFVADPSTHFAPAEEMMKASRSFEISDDLMKNLQDTMQKEAEQATNFAKDAAKLAGVPFEIRIVKGHPADEVLKAANDTDLVVMGSLGRTGISRYLLGSVTEKVIRNSKTPVMVVY
jgi:nucleotide-binding universal stress UspA family protein